MCDAREIVRNPIKLERSLVGVLLRGKCRKPVVARGRAEIDRSAAPIER